MSKKNKGVKLLRGADLVEYISTRQAKTVRRFVQALGITPKLVILNANPTDLGSKKYTELKRLRGEELGIDVKILNLKEGDIGDTIDKLNSEDSVHGIILQLPLKNRELEDIFLNQIDPHKDVDGLGERSLATPATAKAIDWLLAGFGIELRDKKIVILGKGRLVGGPLYKLWSGQDLDVVALDESASNAEIIRAVKSADIIVSATGKPGILNRDIINNGVVIVDAGVAEKGGELLGDVDPSIYSSNLDIKISPRVGGLGPLTISCLFENLLELIDKHKP